MTPESFNAALAQRKLEAADILLIQAKRGSDADRIRAASAILRIAFFPVASASSRCSAKPSVPKSPQQAEGALSASSGGASSTPSAPETPPPPPHAQRNSPELTLGAPSMHTNEYPTINPTIHTIIERSLVNSS